MTAFATQALANRANAQLSTGPRTEEGKRVSSQNSITDGLSAAQIFVRPDEESDFLILQSSLLAQIQPAGIIQNEFFDLILHAAWNIRRCYTLEMQIQNDALDKGLLDALLDDELSLKLDRVYRYKKMHESSQRRAVSQLRRLQSEDLWRREHQQFIDDPILADTTKIELTLRRLKATQERAKLDIVRRNIESFMAPPSQRLPDR